MQAIQASNKPTVFLGVPTHDGRMDYRVTKAALETATRNHPLLASFFQSSLLAKNMNDMYCAALNNREKHNVKWFAMLHSDIVPENFWLDKLIAQAEEHRADFMSVVAPFKNESGLTSTALSDPSQNDSVWARLTMHQILHEDFPATFDINMAVDGLKRLPAESRINNAPCSRLLANTGCMVMRIDKPWAENIAFKTIDGITKDKHGLFKSIIDSEDWFFTRAIAEQGGKVMCTRAVTIMHLGSYHYNNVTPWGNSIDTASLAKTKTV